MKKEHIGSDFDDFLREENLLEVSEATAAKRVIPFQIAQEIRRCGLDVGDDQEATAACGACDWDEPT